MTNRDFERLYKAMITLSHAFKEAGFDVPELRLSSIDQGERLKAICKSGAAMYHKPPANYPRNKAEFCGVTIRWPMRSTSEYMKAKG